MRSLGLTAIVVVLLACGVCARTAAAAPPVGMAEAFATKCGVRSLAAGPDGNVWFTCVSGAATTIGRVTPTGEVSEFSGPVPANDEPGEIILGADGNLWFTLNTGINLLPKQQHGPAIGRVTPSGELTVYQAGLDPRYGIGEIVAGPDGNVWFATGGSGSQRSVGKITPSGQITEFPVDVGSGEGEVIGLEAGPGGYVWFTKSTGRKAGVLVRLATDGTMTEVGAGVADLDPGPPVNGPDGNLWFLQYADPLGVGRATPDGQVTNFSAGFKDASETGSLISGPGSNLWFTAQAPPLIGRVSTGGAIDEFSRCLRYSQPYFGPETLIDGPDGNLWFTSLATRSLPNISDPPSIGRITPDGQITQIYGGVDQEPQSIVAGPDGGIWFSGGADEIQRIAPFTAPVNTVRVLHARRASAAGVAKFPVIVAGPGKLTIKPLALLLPHRRTAALHGPASTVRTAECGTPVIKLKPSGPALERFRRVRRVHERVMVTFTPAGGTPYSEVTSVTIYGPPRSRHHSAGH